MRISAGKWILAGPSERSALSQRHCRRTYLQAFIHPTQVHRLAGIRFAKSGNQDVLTSFLHDQERQIFRHLDPQSVGSYYPITVEIRID